MRDCLHRQAPDLVGCDGRWCAGMSAGMIAGDERRMELPINQFVMAF